VTVEPAEILENHARTLAGHPWFTANAGTYSRSGTAWANPVSRISIGDARAGVELLIWDSGDADLNVFHLDEIEPEHRFCENADDVVRALDRFTFVARRLFAGPES
jgi:hypothetical protein